MRKGAIFSEYVGLIQEAQNLEKEAADNRRRASNLTVDCKHKWCELDKMIDLATRTAYFERGCFKCGLVEHKEGDGKILTSGDMSAIALERLMD